MRDATGEVARPEMMDAGAAAGALVDAGVGSKGREHVEGGHVEGGNVGGSRIRLGNVIPYLSIHAICFGAIWTGWSWVAVGVCAGLFLVRMFVITAFYHRYFSHRTFKAGRVVQFIAAFIGTTTAQRGPIWWAAHHRNHHRHSDEPPDLHSPRLFGLFWSHMGWFLSDDGFKTDWKQVPDWAKVRELVWMDKWHLIGPLVLAFGMYGLGAVLATFAPSLGTSGWQMFVWGFGISTTLLYHATFTINSLAHTIGSRRFATSDDSRNNFVLALLTLGEGWHNNHHHFPGSARQGFYWWEIDPTYYGLRAMQGVGLISGLRPVPARVYRDAEVHKERVREERERVASARAKRRAEGREGGRSRQRGGLNAEMRCTGVGSGEESGAS